MSGDGEVRFRTHGSHDHKVIDFDWDNLGFGGACVYRFTRHVVDHYQNRTDLQNTGREYLINQQIEEAIYDSDRDGIRKVLIAG